MRFLRLQVRGRGPVLAVLRDGDIWVVKRRDGEPLAGVLDYLSSQGSLEEIGDEWLLERVASYAEVERRAPGEETHLLVPIEAPEVWGCGVTYERSRAAREVETSVKGIYERVYEAQRPEIFFKSTPPRYVGPNAPVYIRSDSEWTVPEPELAFAIGLRGEIIGYTIGNDVSARDIEGENPLYLPQAKIYAASCSLGPWLVTPREVGDPHSLEITMRILRRGEVAYEGSVNTRRMKRRIEELHSYLRRDNPTPPGLVCLTGTGIVPPDDFTLRDGDTVEIEIEKLGVLRNPVIKLRA